MNTTISHNNNRIILSHERKNKAVMDIYHTQHLLTYVREGILKVKSGKKSHCFFSGEYVLFKKFTPATITKTWSKDSIKFSSIVFTFHEDLIQEAFMQLRLPFKNKYKRPLANILPIHSNPLLTQFIQSLQLFFEQSIEMDNNLARLKTLEVIIGIIKSDESIAYQLQDFSVRNKADLHEYMKFHYLENKNLGEFARASGRSLSSFKRDFQTMYQIPPYEWLKQQRLEFAFKILTTTNRKASEIYLECGFEDLAHFSKSFKNKFGVNPSQILEPHKQVN